LEGGLVHAGHAGAVVLSWKTMDVNFQWDRAHRRTEVKQSHLLDKAEEGGSGEGTKRGERDLM